MVACNVGLTYCSCIPPVSALFQNLRDSKADVKTLASTTCTKNDIPQVMRFSEGSSLEDTN